VRGCGLTIDNFQSCGEVQGREVLEIEERDEEGGVEGEHFCYAVVGLMWDILGCVDERRVGRVLIDLKSGFLRIILLFQKCDPLCLKN
jgi:hypothetical protein